MSIFTRFLGIPEKNAVPYLNSSSEELAARWVQWAASTNTNSNPIADQTGGFALAGQPDDVWFLAGCFGGVVTRRCIIPANRKIFFPVFNTWVAQAYEFPEKTKIYGHLNVDGRTEKLESIYTDKFFEVKGVWGNPVTNSIFTRSMVVGGLWKLLDPLDVGDHELVFQGGNGKGFTLKVTYYLTVSPE